MMPNLPFPDLEVTTKQNVMEAKLKNDTLADMLRKAIESKGQKVKSVEVYPDAFVVIVDLTDLEKSLTNYGLKASIEPKEIKIEIDRKELVNAFVNVTGASQKGLEVVDGKDYILIRGRITP